MIYLLDTNVCIGAMRRNERVVRKLAGVHPGDCAVSMVTVFELFAGVFRCRDPKAEELRVMTFLAPLHLLPFDWDSSLRTAEVRFELEKQGKRIGPYDLQLCGQALALDLTLMTHNVREFQRVDGLRLEDWELEDA